MDGDLSPTALHALPSSAADKWFKLGTILQFVIFRKLKSGDGQNVSQQKVVHAE